MAFLAAFWAVFLAGCDTLKTRPDSVGTKHTPIVTHAPSPRPTPAPVLIEAPPQVHPVPAPTPAPTPVPVPPAPQMPTFLNKEMPKVGLILGPGGMKTYAELGVLREFAKARIPVHAVVGLEWGSVIGSLYASQGQANDAEWKAFKLREQELPGESGFLSSKIKPQSVALLGEFFETVLGGIQIESAKIDFACPAYWSRVDRFGWMSKGAMKEAMRACVPYLPFFTDNAGVLAAPFAVEEAAAYLRSRGANLIILVNPLGAGEFLPAKLAQGEQAAENLLWSEIRREMLRAKPPLVHWTININTSGHPVTDYAGRRALLEKGARAAGEVVSKLVSQYGF